jgi:hypothetical protein
MEHFEVGGGGKKASAEREVKRERIECFSSHYVQKYLL